MKNKDNGSKGNDRLNSEQDRNYQIKNGRKEDENNLHRKGYCVNSRKKNGLNRMIDDYGIDVLELGY